MKYVRLAQEKDEGYIFRQKDEPENFYVVVKGTLVVEIDGVERTRLIPGDSFGEIALTENILRTASLRQLNHYEDVILLALCWKIFEGYKRSFFTKLQEDTVKLMEQIPLFSKKLRSKRDYLESLRQEEKLQLSQVMSYMHRYKGDVIVRKGEPALSYYLIMSGYVNCCDIAA